MRLRARTDRNQTAIVEYLRGLGYSVQSLAQVGKGIPDLLVGVPLKKNLGINFLFEVKAPGGRETPDQITWAVKWLGQVHIVKTGDECKQIIDDYLFRIGENFDNL